MKVFGTDGDRNLSSSFSACFGDAYHLLCDLHMYDNIQRKLSDICIPRKTAKLYLEEIFGKDCDASPVKSLVNCSSPSEFDSLFETLKPSWISRHKNGEQFVHYFSKYKAPEIINCMNANLRSMCGLGFPPKPYTQNASECINAVMKSDIRQDQGRRKKITAEEFCKCFQNTVETQQEEVKKALYGQGQYSLKAEYAHLQVEETEFWRKSSKQREGLFQR